MVKKKIAIITDSTCDIPQALIEQYAIHVVHHVIIWGEEQYRDRVDMMPDEFYRRLRTDDRIPTTSQATIADFAGAYQEVCEQGAESIVVITVSEKLSGAIQSARQAAAQSPVPVHIYDSRGATMGLGWQVIAAARAREQGGSETDMLAAADRVRKNVHLLISLDTLEYLGRGGRIGNARRMLGSVLHIKPLIYVDHESGIVESGGMAMTRNKALDMLYKKFFERLDTSRPMHIAVLHGDAKDDAEALAARIREEYNPAEQVMNITCPALGIHTGPKALALCGYSESE